MSEPTRELRFTPEMAHRMALRRALGATLDKRREFDPRFRQKLVSELADGLYAGGVRIPQR